MKYLNFSLDLASDPVNPTKNSLRSTFTFTVMASELSSEKSKGQSIEDTLRTLSDEKLMGEFDDIFKLMPVTDDTACGVGALIRGRSLQR